ncbi:N-acetylglucosamine-binding protein GbpA [Aeromonas diversa]|uniref:N-acetylglucosamine-binding protein GbpA n=1 Tax=Aeromonas diversa TaxID=502790 RepID=UPI0039A09231
MTATHFRSLALLCALSASTQVLAHGYISLPESRSYLCKSGGNIECGAIQWEPQSLEAPSGFPQKGPADGQIASAGHKQFGELNTQTSDRWTKREVSAGPFAFTWTFTANHVTRHWRYYLTRQEWDPNRPLTRDAFELTPFCVIDGGMKQPPKVMTHNCTLPTRTGYQLILGVWEVGDTSNSFYNLVDARFQGGDQPPQRWRQGGTLYPSVDLTPGDRVLTRVFDAAGERGDLQTELTIASDEQGLKNNWTHALAGRINAEQASIRAGQQGGDGTFNPVFGQNPLYLKQGSGLERVEIQIEQRQPPAGQSLTVSGVAGDLMLDGGKLALDVTVAVQGEMAVSATLYDHAGVARGQLSAELRDEQRAFTLVLEGLSAGHHQLVVKGVPKMGGEAQQQTVDLMLSEPAQRYDYRFPEGLKDYVADTRVLQPKDGRIYRCKPFPYSGYCIQWTSSATHYEPGIGSHWQSAWDLVD